MESALSTGDLQLDRIHRLSPQEQKAAWVQQRLCLCQCYHKGIVLHLHPTGLPRFLGVWFMDASPLVRVCLPICHDISGWDRVSNLLSNSPIRPAVIIWSVCNVWKSFSSSEHCLTVFISWTAIIILRTFQSELDHLHWFFMALCNSLISAREQEVSKAPFLKPNVKILAS